jgi:ribosomal protein S12 methylthiotransferase
LLFKIPVKVEGYDDRRMNSLAALIHLGCAKNLVDSETVVPQVLASGYTMTDDPAQASLILVNTCGFLESAVEEAIETILEASQHKTSGNCACLLVMGCMVQRYGKKLLPLLPEVDLFVGTSHYHEISSILESLPAPSHQRLWIAAPRHVADSRAPRVRSTPGYSAYLKIAEGCSNRCTFCLIPQLRGPYRSRTIGDVMREATQMVAEGVREINLIAQDITAYGGDQGNPAALVHLLGELEALPDLAWLRLLYAYPGRIDEALLKVMAHSTKIVPYLDFPIQHCVPRILQAMHRGEIAPDMPKLIERIRWQVPQIALRTSVMVGFPGESEADFEKLLHFVEDVQFDHLGVFAFSPETGSRAAKLPDQVPEPVKQARREHLLEVQRNISYQRLKRLIGCTLPVLIEGVHPETDLLLVGRLATQAPEVDGVAIITKGTGDAGQIMPLAITAVEDYDVIGELVNDGHAGD